MTDFVIAIETGLARNIQAEVQKELENASSEVWKTRDQGCATALVAAWDPSLPAEAIYLSDCQIRRPSRHACDKQAAERLWKLSETFAIPRPNL